MHETFFENITIIFKKGMDKPIFLCYNIATIAIQ